MNNSDENSKNRVAITKNGCDILRIISFSNDGNNCDFKISPRIDPKKVDIYSRKLFSPCEKYLFDKDKKLEVTYHKSREKLPTEIHIKSINKSNEKDYSIHPLNLKKLLDPDVNTEIPIPLLRMIIPDEILTVPYKKSAEHKEFDIQDNNIIDIFLTKPDFIKEDFMSNWPKVSRIILGADIQYYVTISREYIDKNFAMSFKNAKDHKHLASIATNITKDYGILISTTKYPYKLKTDKLTMFFIENSAYLGSFSLPIAETAFSPTKEAYKYDIENFNKEKKEKWETIFKNAKRNLDIYIHLHRAQAEKYIK